MHELRSALGEQPLEYRGVRDQHSLACRNDDSVIGDQLHISREGERCQGTGLLPHLPKLVVLRVDLGPVPHFLLAALFPMCDLLRPDCILESCRVNVVGALHVNTLGDAIEGSEFTLDWGRQRVVHGAWCCSRAWTALPRQ